jgi:RNA polymerase II C-terminal domain phosphatase-like 3/4
MSLAAESPSPAPSSSSGSDDFAALLDSELELASAVDSASPDDPATSLASSDDDDEEEEDAVVEVEDAGQSRYEICNPHFVPECWACLLRLCDQELPIPRF